MSEDKPKRPGPKLGKEITEGPVAVTYLLGWGAPSRARCESCAADTWWRERGDGYRECLRCGLAVRR